MWVATRPPRNVAAVRRHVDLAKVCAPSTAHLMPPRSWSQYQLAAGVALFELPVRVPHIVEGEDSGDRHFQLTPCDEVGQLGDHRCGRGIRAACRLDPEPLHGSEIGDGVDPVARDFEVLDRHGDISTTEEIQQGVDASGRCCGAQPGRQVVTIVDRDRAMVGEPGIVGRPGDAEDRGPGASGELNRDRTDTAGRTRDRHRLPRYEAHRPHRGVGGGARDKQRAGHLPRKPPTAWRQLVRRHRHVLGVAGPSVGEPDHLIAHSETADAGTEFGHHPRQVAALTGRKRRPGTGRARAPLRITASLDIDACCPDLDQNLTGSRNRAGHVAHLEDVDAAVRIELHCFGHERISSIRLVDQVMLHSERSTLFGRPGASQPGAMAPQQPSRDPFDVEPFGPVSRALGRVARLHRAAAGELLRSTGLSTRGRSC